MPCLRGRPGPGAGAHRGGGRRRREAADGVEAVGLGGEVAAAVLLLHADGLPGVIAVAEEEHDAVLRDMRARGVRFVTGLDMGMAHGEFDMSAANAWSFVDLLGFTNWEAIAASTVDTAESLRLSSETGTIKAGLNADLMAVSGDPSNDIKDLFKVSDVVIGGHMVKRSGRALV